MDISKESGAGVKGFITCSVLTWREGANVSPTMAKNKTPYYVIVTIDIS